ncbi:MAG: 3-phosphoshikimate 1-carboxyvinyltransferase [Calditrichaeota bacterium]|nr:MAG: 3-phosphoshikimate 1-carboxyvinyltransferase [Calditrichota bacterium]MBL1204152.1 3-phosphoshikimate 1-carboxyvinyltransferase [Calditrichota bacterium]NOG43983.1 3-phosphoshikimate 1-carboxyvinyltransferase [Calditrichota bacterium]
MIQGKIKLPGDKSISHRAALFSALREGESHFTNFNLNNDCKATLSCLEKLGIEHKKRGTNLTIFGKSFDKWQKPNAALDAQNSGTTARLLSGLLAALPFDTKLVGDSSLSNRPMDRVVKPLQKMGARIDTTLGCLPLTFTRKVPLQGIAYTTPMASAQVKSAILLAGLYAEGKTKVTENSITRDHTERMLSLNSEITDKQKHIESSSLNSIPDLSMEIPGDFSSAAFFICAALAIPGSSLRISRVSLNPTRIGLINVLKEMGAQLEFNIEQEKPEPIGTIDVSASKLQNLNISKKIIPNIIDEIPILAVLATQAHGDLVLRNAEELRYKESDRINTIVQNLRKLDVEVDEFKDGFNISGPQKLGPGTIETHGDHRIAMAFSIANQFTNSHIEIDDPECAAVSFPGFYKTLDSIVK